jgi:hypothetical protein
MEEIVHHQLKPSKKRINNDKHGQTAYQLVQDFATTHTVSLGI